MGYGLYFQSDQTAESLKEELRRILPQVEEMRKRKSDRKKQFVDVLEQIEMIKSEICGSTACISSETVMDDADLSLRKLEEFQRELHELQKEKVGMTFSSLFFYLRSDVIKLQVSSFYKFELSDFYSFYAVR